MGSNPEIPPRPCRLLLRELRPEIGPARVSAVDTAVSLAVLAERRRWPYLVPAGEVRVEALLAVAGTADHTDVVIVGHGLQGDGIRISDYRSDAIDMHTRPGVDPPGR